MVKRALLVGCNYPGSKHKLNGCVNDVHKMHEMLQTHFGFEDFTILIDTDPNSEQPTGANIKRRLTELVAASQPGDLCFFHYSGHGTQVPSDGEEADGKDEALAPTDMNCITDDDLRVILSKLPDGVKFTFVADCCHSGTLLDQPRVQISGPKTDDPAAPPQLIDTFTAGLGGDHRDITGRSISTDDYLAALSEKLGVPIEPGQVRAALVAAFGADATAKLGPLIEKFDSAVKAAGGVEALAAQATSTLNQLLPGAGDAVGGLLGAAGGLLGGLNLGGGEEEEGGSGSRGLGSALFGVALNILMDPNMMQTLPSAGAKPSPSDMLPPGRATLITGCQAHETSADACPGGDPANAFGALTNALTSAVNQFKAAYPDKEVSARTLVSVVRDSLTAGRFAQNPCLECDDECADAAFIVA